MVADVCKSPEHGVVVSWWPTCAKSPGQGSSCRGGRRVQIPWAGVIAAVDVCKSPGQGSSRWFTCANPLGRGHRYGRRVPIPWAGVVAVVDVCNSLGRGLLTGVWQCGFVTRGRCVGVPTRVHCVLATRGCCVGVSTGV
jgi:hypothetical protein